jgi:hypothetical protein
MTEEAALSPRSFPQSSRGAIGGQQAALSGGVSIQDDFDQIISRLFGDVLAQEQIVDDQQVGFGEELGHLFPALELIGFEQVFEKDMGFPIDDLVAGLNGGMRHRLGDMALAGPGRPNQQGVGPVPNKLAAHQLVDFLAGQLGIKPKFLTP